MGAFSPKMGPVAAKAKDVQWQSSILILVISLPHRKARCFIYLSQVNWFHSQAYDISNIQVSIWLRQSILARLTPSPLNSQGFTQSISIAVNGCDTVTCTNVNCGCSSAYPPGVSAIGFAHTWFVPTCGCIGSFGMWQRFTSPWMLCWRSLVDYHLLSLSL